MRCEDIVVELDAYSTGELEAETCAEIERHIWQCQSCRDELSTLRHENDLYKDFVSTIPCSPLERGKRRFSKIFPVRRAWYGRGRLFSISAWGWAAAATIIIATGLFLRLQVHQNAPAAVESIAAEQPAAVSMAQAFKDMERAIAMLQATYLENKARLDPDLVKELDRNLEITRAAIRECNEVLETDSNNRQAMEFLAFGYQKHLEILKHFSEGL